MFVGDEIGGIISATSDIDRSKGESGRHEGETNRDPVRIGESVASDVLRVINSINMNSVLQFVQSQHSISVREKLIRDENRLRWEILASDLLDPIDSL